MRLEVAIFHDSQSRKAAPPQWRVLSTRGFLRTRLPSPRGTRNIMSPMPVVTPNRHGSPFRTPAFAPAAVSMILLGPGVIAATTANRKNATTCSVVVLYLHESRGRLGPLSRMPAHALQGSHIRRRGS